MTKNQLTRGEPLACRIHSQAADDICMTAVNLHTIHTTKSHFTADMCTCGCIVGVNKMCSCGCIVGVNKMCTCACIVGVNKMCSCACIVGIDEKNISKVLRQTPIGY